MSTPFLRPHFRSLDTSEMQQAFCTWSKSVVLFQQLWKLNHSLLYIRRQCWLTLWRFREYRGSLPSLKDSLELSYHLCIVDSLEKGCPQAWPSRCVSFGRCLQVPDTLVSDGKAEPGFSFSDFQVFQPWSLVGPSSPRPSSFCPFYVLCHWCCRELHCFKSGWRKMLTGKLKAVQVQFPAL